MSQASDLISKFYTAFAGRDFAQMQACYHPEVAFSDPVFPDLRGNQARAMWHMLCLGEGEFRLEFSQIAADDHSGSAHWEAHYAFSGTGRPVHNIVEAEFGFRDGLIVRHRDRFDLWRWTRMALGASGLLLGWSPLVQNKVRAMASGKLKAFVAKHPDYR